MQPVRAFLACIVLGIIVCNAFLSSSLKCLVAVSFLQEGMHDCLDVSGSNSIHVMFTADGPLNSTRGSMFKPSFLCKWFRFWLSSNMVVWRGRVRIMSVPQRAEFKDRSNSTNLIFSVDRSLNCNRGGSSLGIDRTLYN